MSEKKILNIKTPCLMLFSAKRNSGKSHSITWLLYRLCRRFQHIIVMSSTAFNGHYAQYLPKECIFPNFDEDKINQLFERQKKILSEQKNKPENILLILDDVVSQTTFKSSVFQRIACEGRHYLITVFITSQHWCKIPPIIRVNCDYIAILGPQTKTVQQMIFDEFGMNNYEKINDFMQRLKLCTEKYGIFVIDNLTMTDHGIRAPEKLPKYRIKSKQ